MKLYNVKQGIKVNKNRNISTDKLFPTVQEAIDNLDCKFNLIGNYKYEYSFLTIEEFNLKKGEPLKLLNSKIVRLNKLNLTDYNTFTGEYSGSINEFIYENEIENIDRICTVNFINKNIYKSFKNVCKNLDIPIKMIESYKDYIYYNNSIKSNRKREIYKINFVIPKEINALPIWKILDENTKYFNSKKIKPSDI